MASFYNGEYTKGAQDLKSDEPRGLGLLVCSQVQFLCFELFSRSNLGIFANLHDVETSLWVEIFGIMCCFSRLQLFAYSSIFQFGNFRCCSLCI